MSAVDAGQRLSAVTYPADITDGRLPQPFEQHREAARWVRSQHIPGASQLVWFLRREDSVEFGVGANGRLWSGGGTSHDLLPLYRRLDSSLPRLLDETPGDLLPR